MTCPWTILVVEDDVGVRTMLSRQLAARCACSVIEAEEGACALELLSQHPTALVIVDLGLPGIDGLEMTRRIRALPSLASQVPILVISASPAAQYAATAYAAGCNGYIQKPILDFEAFTATVLQLLAGRELHDGIRRRLV